MFDDAPLGLDLSVLWFAIYGSFFFFFCLHIDFDSA